MPSYPPISRQAPFIWHGGDYNPEQWPPPTWDDDVALMQQAHFNIATVGVFSWVSLQPAEDQFTWAWLDAVLDTLEAGGRRNHAAGNRTTPPPVCAQSQRRNDPRR